MGVELALNDQRSGTTLIAGNCHVAIALLAIASNCHSLISIAWQSCSLSPNVDSANVTGTNVGS